MRESLGGEKEVIIANYALLSRAMGSGQGFGSSREKQARKKMNPWQPSRADIWTRDFSGTQFRNRTEKIVERLIQKKKKIREGTNKDGKGLGNAGKLDDQR